jgi:hypothetical protein
MKKINFLYIAAVTLAFSACTTAPQTEEAEVSDSSEPIVEMDSGTGEKLFSPENEGWIEFKNENLMFSYPDGFTVIEQGESVYLTNSNSSAPLGMEQGEMWVNFLPSSKEEAKSENNIAASEGIAEEKYLTNVDGDWYKIQFLMGGNGETTSEAEVVFDKLETTLYAL